MSAYEGYGLVQWTGQMWALRKQQSADSLEAFLEAMKPDTDYLDRFGDKWAVVWVYANPRKTNKMVYNPSGLQSF